ncbi:MAG TPA: T9SS type A sorting domain-containing protein, partial [Flavipsychrobacter sp.]|nr:T9SS type A sorting domain-containing protein [Flavipsychrobacter sp.]
VDNTPVPGTNYYRLLLKDVNNKTIYSEVVKAIVKTTGFTVEAYPNPATDVVRVRVHGVQGKDAKVFVTDLAGKVIRTLTMSGTEQLINVNGLANGVYMIKYVDTHHQQTMRVTKQ